MIFLFTPGEFQVPAVHFLRCIDKLLEHFFRAMSGYLKSLLKRGTVRSYPHETSIKHILA